MKLSRRKFLAASGSGLLAWSSSGLAFSALRPCKCDGIGNPLTKYPNRGWEKVYRDQYKVDGSFTWICSPNCTHECRLRAFTRNGVVLRTEQNYEKGRITDMYGVKATSHWNPRGCPNGFTFQRRMYGPYRLRYPLIRRGWKKWADDGFPELTKANKKKYKFDSRGTDTFVRVNWDDAYTYASNGFIQIAQTYSGEEGKRRLLKQGYDPETLTHWDGAGTRTLKFRGGMGLLGVIGKYGMYRFANTMSLVDSHLRGVTPKKARGGRAWSNYTWHGDQAPGHPFVHGLQASDCDFNDLRNSKLQVMVGKNLVENKRPDSHFFIECMERGAKVVVIAPEYSPPATKADYWIPIRPQTDTALFLGLTKIMIDRGWYDEKFVKEFTDFPILIRKDNLRRLRPEDVIKDYQNQDISKGPSFKIQGLTKKLRDVVGDFMVWDKGKNEAVPITRDDVGRYFSRKNVDAALAGKFNVTLVNGKEIEVMPLFEVYKSHHLRDYDLDTVHEITHSPKELIVQLAKDMATIKPVAIHEGEGINHWFHATMTNRATYLPMSLTGNIGKPGAGSHTWAGNYKAALFQGSKWSGPGFKGWIAEDPFNPNLDPKADGKNIKVRATIKDEEPAYWNYGDKPLVVNTPKFGRKVFTGKTHMPSPTKAMWFTNVNIFNNAKWLYEMLQNVNPNIEMIVCSEIEMTSTAEYSDILLPANTWMEFEQPEVTAACSNPFLQIWKGGVKPIYETKDDILIMAEMAKKLGEILKDKRFKDYWKFALDGKSEVYIQRLLDASTPTRGYKYDDVMAGKYGEPGTALMLFRSYPRVPFLEQIEDSVPFYSPTGRLQAYNDEPEVIEYGENLIVHREGPEGTPYLPNVIVSSSPFIRPEDYGIPREHMGWDERQVRNIKLSWKDVKNSKNPLWEAGYKFFCLTPKSRHSTHSSWQVTDWNFIWASSFGDPYRIDRRQPGVGEQQVQMNPEAATDLGFKEGDYVYVDANPADRPYLGWKPSDPFYKVARLMLRVKFNSAYPYQVVMIKHGAWGATEKSVKGHESRKDGRAISADTGYQSSYRYGSHQSITRAWLMPMHQLDSLFHKKKVHMSFMLGGEADNHAINTVPKETLVKLTKAEDGGLGGKGVWAPATSGYSIGNEGKFMQRYLQGIVKVKKG